MNRRAAVLTLCTLCLAGAGVAQAQQLENAGFDADLQHWTDPGYSDRLLSWSSEDSAASLSSGSLLHVGDDTSGGVALGLEQCVDVQAGGIYQLDGEALVPSGQSGSIAPYIFLQEYDGDACDAYTGRYWATGPFLVEGTWGSFDGLEAELLSTTESVKILLGAWVEAGGIDLEAHFDDISLSPAAGPIFADGFETGSTGGWSAASP